VLISYFSSSLTSHRQL